MRTIMITGGHGFIGSNLIRYWLRKYPHDTIVNVDALTYAARPAWTDELFIKEAHLAKRYVFERADITDHASVLRLMHKHAPDDIIHLAAESHVCRSIAGPKVFIGTNIQGTFHLLEEFKNLWGNNDAHRFHHVSTDEVFGQLGPYGRFTESSPLAPRSPYAGSKAASDMLVNVYSETYGLNTVITNCSNNFGPNQHAEKLIPRSIQLLLEQKPMTVYQNGRQVRDWLYVDDHCSAIDTVFHCGEPGNRYCVGSDNELTNLEVIEATYELLKGKTGRNLELKIEFTGDRPTDDFRYAIDNTKLRKLGWNAGENMKQDLGETIEWYMDRMDFFGVPK